MSADTPQLYLVIAAGSAAPERLRAVLARVRAASVLIEPEPGAVLDAASAGPLVEIAQAHQAAALIADDARLARVLRADGVHLGVSDHSEERQVEAREILGGRGIVGVDPGASRHAAMLAAETGADYVAFSHAGSGDGREDLVAWWAEIFEVPVVAFESGSVEEAERLLALGADFLAARIATGSTLAVEIERIEALAAIIERHGKVVRV